jgi:hypothetical protein
MKKSCPKTEYPGSIQSIKENAEIVKYNKVR